MRIMSVRIMPLSCTQYMGRESELAGLLNNYPIELMQRAVAVLKGWLGQRHAT
jgi:hypothetical protein